MGGTAVHASCVDSGSMLHGAWDGQARRRADSCGGRARREARREARRDGIEQARRGYRRRRRHRRRKRRRHRRRRRIQEVQEEGAGGTSTWTAVWSAAAEYSGLCGSRSCWCRGWCVRCDPDPTTDPR